MNNNHSLTCNLSSEMSARTEALRREGQTVTELMEQIYNMGLNQLEYRRKKQPELAQERKEAMKLFRRAQQDPELAVKLGLGRRVAL